MLKSIVISIFFLVSAFTSISAYAASEFKVAVSTTAMQNIFLKVDKAFEKKTGIKITYVGDYKTSDAVEHMMNMLKGNAEASTSGNKSSEVIKLAKDRKYDHPDFSKITERLIGRDMMLLYSNKANNVKKLSAEQIHNIFVGKIKNWKEIGGADLPVKIILQAGKPATMETFRRLALKGEDFPKDAIKEKSHEDSVGLAGKTPGAIAFGPGGFPFDGTVLVETEPIGRAIFLFTVGKPSETVLKFIDFLNKDGRALGVGI